MAESKRSLSHESEAPAADVIESQPSQPQEQTQNLPDKPPLYRPQNVPGQPTSPQTQPQYSPALPQYSPAQPQYPPAQPQYPSVQPQYPPAQPQYPSAQPQYQSAQPQLVTAQPVMNTSNTTVVIGGPMGEVKGPRDWNDGLCGCFNDCGSCCRGVFCASSMLFEISNRMGEGCWFPCCCTGALIGLRIKLRMQENIQGTLFDDYCAVQFCYLCALCQMVRELNYIHR